MKAIILDTETSDLNEPEVLELAFTSPLESVHTEATLCALRFRPTKGIKLGAMATHHIIDDDLATCELWPGRWPVPDGIGYLIGHNVDFDWKAIGSPQNVKRICTLALARAHFPSLDSHSLGAIIYSLYPQKMARELVRNAHSARTDVENTHRVLFAVHQAVGKPQTWEEFWELSEKARVPERIGFGKYGPHEAWAKANGQPGMRCREIKHYDPSYHSWLLTKCDQVRDDPYLRKALTQ